MSFVKFLAATFVGGYFWCTLLIGAGYLLGGADRVIQNITGAQGTNLVTLVVSFALGLMWFAVLARRAHDRNHPGWYPIVIGVIPIVGVVWLFIEFGFFRGTVGANKYGDDPITAALPA